MKQYWMPPAWQELDEYERLGSSYHRHCGVHNPNDDLHAALHTIVENQIALGDVPGGPKAADGGILAQLGRACRRP